jgi:ankyrin repeat protein
MGSGFRSDVRIPTTALEKAVANIHEMPLADYLLERDADLNWIGYDGLSPLDAASRSGAKDLVGCLLSRGAKSAIELE